MPQRDLRNAPALAVEGERVVLSTAGPTPRNARVTRLRPRTAAALITLRPLRPADSREPIEVNAGVKRPRRVARLSEAEAFAEVESTDGLIDVRSLNGGARIGNYSAKFVRAVLDHLEADREIPPHIQFRPPPHPVGPHRAIAAAFELSLPVPDIIADMRFFSRGFEFSNIVLGPHSTLVISDDVSHLICLNFVAYGGARVVQETPYLVVDVLGSMAGSVKLTLPDPSAEKIVAKLPPEPLKINDLPALGIHPIPPGL